MGARSELNAQSSLHEQTSTTTCCGIQGSQGRCTTIYSHMAGSIRWMTAKTQEATRVRMASKT